MSDNKQCFSFKTSPDAISEMGFITENYLVNKLELVSAQLEYFKNINTTLIANYTDDDKVFSL